MVHKTSFRLLKREDLEPVPHPQAKPTATTTTTATSQGIAHATETADGGGHPAITVNSLLPNLEVLITGVVQKCMEQGNGDTCSTSSNNMASLVSPSSKENLQYFMEQVECCRSHVSPDDGNLLQRRCLTTLVEACNEKGGLTSLPTAYLVNTCGIKPELYARIEAVRGDHDNWKLSLNAASAVVHANSSQYHQDNADRLEYNEDNYLFIDEIDDEGIEVEGKIPMDEFSRVGCAAVGRATVQSVVFAFHTNKDEPTTVQLQVASKNFASSQTTMNEVAKLVPDLVKLGLVSCEFDSNISEPEDLPVLPIEKNAIQRLAKESIDVEIIFNSYVLDIMAQRYLNIECNARLNFTKCRFNDSGAMLMWTTVNPLKIAFKGEREWCYPALKHLAAAVEGGWIQSLLLCKEGAYKLNGDEDQKNLKRFCEGAIRAGHKLAWGNRGQIRLGKFATMPEDETATIVMGEFDLDAAGTKTRLLVAEFIAKAEK
jgi:hypothetical protein